MIVVLDGVHQHMLIYIYIFIYIFLLNKQISNLQHCKVHFMHSSCILFCLHLKQKRQIKDDCCCSILDFIMFKLLWYKTVVQVSGRRTLVEVFSMPRLENLLFNFFLVMVFCNKCPLWILIQVFVSYLLSFLTIESCLTQYTVVLEFLPIVSLEYSSRHVVN